MRVVFAPDSFGGFMSAPEVCRFVVQRLREAGVDATGHPMADGGEGTLEVLAHHAGLPWEGGAHLDYQGVLAVESARLLGPRAPGMNRPCLERSSALLGRHLAALVSGAAAGPMMIGLGGTATMDGGAGALQTLGLSLLDRRGRRLPVGIPARALHEVDRIVGRPATSGAVLRVLVDVRTPFLDAPRVFGPQKGLPPAEVELGRERLAGFAECLSAWRQDQGWAPLDIELPGGGAAGGLGLALASLGAHIAPGARSVSRLTGLPEVVRGAAAVVVGEGRLDWSSFQGKVAGEVTALARGLGVHRVLALVGALTSAPPPPVGPDQVITAAGPPDRDRLMAAVDLLVDALR